MDSLYRGFQLQSYSTCNLGIHHTFPIIFPFFLLNPIKGNYKIMSFSDTVYIRFCRLRKLQKDRGRKTIILSEFEIQELQFNRVHIHAGFERKMNVEHRNLYFHHTSTKIAIVPALSPNIMYWNLRQYNSPFRCVTGENRTAGSWLFSSG